MRKIFISPSILSGDFANMESSVKMIADNGADMVHCDVMDGVYVKNLTFGMPMVKALRGVTKLPLDVHLMITKPERYVAEFVKSGADIVTFHPDASDKPEETLRLIKNAGAKCGIVFNPDIEIEKYKSLFPLCDVILVMSVFAGLGGQKFIPYCLDRIAVVKKYLTEMKLDIPVEVDGGVTEENSAEVIKAGADILVAGSAVYNSPDMRKTIANLRHV